MLSDRDGNSPLSSNGSHDLILSTDPFEEGLIQPKRYALSICHSTSNTSISSNERIFPLWFATESLEESKSSFRWSKSSPEDDLPDIEDLHLLFSPRTDNERSLPEIKPHMSFKVDLAHLFKDSEEDQILEFCILRVFK